MTSQPPIARRPIAPSLCLIAFLFLAAAGSIDLAAPPHAVPADASATEFSSARAMRHLETIAAHPHPAGSPRNAQVREYLVKQLTSLGLDVETQQVANPDGLDLHNIVARLKGTGDAKAVLLSAHYDSRSHQVPGAGDDGAAVAAILEGLRALRAGPPLKRDLVVLVTDSEETGLRGAKTFVAQCPWLSRILLVLNFEARGNRGPSFMFQTSPGNGRLVREFAVAAPHASGSSFSVEVYKRMPNDTDFTIFQQAGLAGLNFAFFEGLTHYHTHFDNVPNLDERSLQHHGSHVLALARHFGNLETDDLSAPDVVYFNAIGPWVIGYPMSWVAPLTMLNAAACLAVLMRACLRKQITPLRVLLGIAVFVSGIAITCAVVMLAWHPAETLHERYGTLVHGDTFNHGCYMVSFAALAVCVMGTIQTLARTLPGTANLAAGAMLVWLGLAMFATVYVPGGSYLFVWPLLFGLPGFLWLCNPEGTRSHAWRAVTVLSVSAVPSVVLLSPLIYLLFTIVGTTGFAAVVSVVALLSGLLVPQWQFIRSSRRWLLPLVSAAVSASAYVAGLMTAAALPS